MRGLFRRQSHRWRSFAPLIVLFVAVAVYVPSAWHDESQDHTHDESQEHTCPVCNIRHQLVIAVSVNLPLQVPEHSRCLAPSVHGTRAHQFVVKQSAPRAPPA